MRFPHRVTLVEPGEGDPDHGVATDDWGDAATRVEDVPGWMQQRRTSETHEPGRDPVVSGWTLFMPLTHLVHAGEDDPPEVTVIEITKRHRVEWDGHTFAVDGDPRRPATPRGPHHLEVPLVLVTG